jgi:hypothetical protein
MSKEDEAIILKALETGAYTRAPNAAQEKEKAEAAARAFTRRDARLKPVRNLFEIGISDGYCDENRS